MRPIHFKGETGSLGPPKGVSEEDCGNLPFQRSVQGSLPCLTSVWRPNPKELEDIKEGGDIRITLFSETHPMMAVTVQNLSPKKAGT